MRDEAKWLLFGTVGVLIFVLVLTWFAASQESKTYNRLTGANTTTWDALWVELRVQDQPKKAEASK